MNDLELLRRSRWLALAAVLAFSPAVTSCGAEENPDSVDAPEDLIEEVTDVSHTAVRRQSIGNCWIYAAVGWAESLHRARANEDLNLSESYITYWDWFTKITTGSGVSTNAEGRTELQTGGWWDSAATIMKQRGVVSEGDFIPEEANAEISQRQAAAERVIQEALNGTGELATATARRDRRLVIRVLQRAFQLNERVVSTLNTTFGLDGYKRVDGTTTTTRATVTNTFVRRAADITIRTRVRMSTGAVGTFDGTLLDVIPGGRYAWRSLSYPTTASARTTFQQRVLRALNAEQPVLISWLVDFNAMSSTGVFDLANIRMPGRQGGHLTVLEDYEVTNVPGVEGGTIRAGQTVDAQTRERALMGTLSFLRIKNSWGSARDPSGSGRFGGYNDLRVNYLNGPIQWTQGTSTTPRTPWSSVVLPPGF